MDSKFEAPDCGYGELLVSYLYDEADADETASVEKHLAGCTACAGEFESLSGVKFSVSEWKTREFDPLPTPSVSIPVAAATLPTNTVQAPEESWLSGLRKFFALSPAWSLAAASLALIVVATGLIFLSVGRGEPGRMAGANSIDKGPQAVAKLATPTPTPSPSPVATPSSDPIPTVQSPSGRGQTPRVLTTRQNKRSSAVDGRKQQTARSPKSKLPADDVSDDEEDDGLRLAELFDEIGMR